MMAHFRSGAACVPEGVPAPVPDSAPGLPPPADWARALGPLTNRWRHRSAPRALECGNDPYMVTKVGVVRKLDSTCCRWMDEAVLEESTRFYEKNRFMLACFYEIVLITDDNRNKTLVWGHFCFCVSQLHDVSCTMLLTGRVMQQDIIIFHFNWIFLLLLSLSSITIIIYIRNISV